MIFKFCLLIKQFRVGHQQNYHHRVNLKKIFKSQFIIKKQIKKCKTFEKNNDLNILILLIKKETCHCYLKQTKTDFKALRRDFYLNELFYQFQMKIHDK